MEGEQWSAVEVPDSFQAVIDSLLAQCVRAAEGRPGEGGAAAAAAAAAGAGGSPVKGRPAPGQSGVGGEGAAQQPSVSGGSGKSPQLHLAGQHFHVVNCTLMLLKASALLPILCSCGDTLHGEAEPFVVDSAQRVVAGCAQMALPPLALSACYLAAC